VIFDPRGVITAKGLVNNREQIEGLLKSELPTAVPVPLAAGAEAGNG
jgi:hypothetical protein